jgi:protein-histidine pros-kinase
LFDKQVLNVVALGIRGVERDRDEVEPFDLMLLDDAVDGGERERLIEAFRACGGVKGGVILLSWSHTEPHEHGLSVRKPVRPSDLFDAIIIALAGNPDYAAAHAGERRLHEPIDDLRILLAEDNAVNQMVATRMLEKAGFRCGVVGDGRAAVEAVRAGEVDLVLMECPNPVLDGIAAARVIRAREQKTGAAPVTMNPETANARQGERERCHDPGMNDYLPQPIQAERLIAKVSEAALGRPAV